MLQKHTIDRKEKWNFLEFRQWLTAKPNAALRFDKSTGNGFSQCLCAWANPCKFITKRWNNFMHVPQVQHFARFIPKYFHGGGSVWWGRQEHAVWDSQSIKSPHPVGSAPDNCILHSLPSENVAAPRIFWLDSVSRGTTGSVWFGFLMACRSSPRTGTRCTLTSSLLICAEFIQAALFPFDRE